jgi:hypothetical protein
MKTDQVPIKTSKGVEEIKSRTYQLSAPLRQILIMVDGHSTVAQLTKKLVGFGAVEALLVELELEGFIAPGPNLVSGDGPSKRLPPDELSRRSIPTAETSKRLMPEERSRRPMPSAETNSQREPSSRRLSANPEPAKRPVSDNSTSLSAIEISRRLTLGINQWPIEELSRRPTAESVSRANAELSRRPIPEASKAVTPEIYKPVTAAKNSAQPEFNLEMTKRFIRHVLTGVAGPKAETVIRQIEVAVTPHELGVALERMPHVLPRILSAEQVERTWQRLELILTAIKALP